MNPLKQSKWSVLLLWIILFMASSLFSQSRTHTLGDFKMNVPIAYLGGNVHSEHVGGSESGQWPQDYYNYSTIPFSYLMIGCGTYLDQDSVEISKIATGWPGEVGSSLPATITEYRKYAPPDVWVYVNGKPIHSSRRFNGVVDPSMNADEMIELTYTHRWGFDVIQRSYSFSNQNNNDYVIFDYVIKASFDTDGDGIPNLPTSQILKNVYFAVGYCPVIAEGTMLTHGDVLGNADDDWTTYEVYKPKLIPGGRDLYISYGWDGDSPNITEFETNGKLFDDTGDPRWAYGNNGATPMPSAEFISTAYTGFAFLHVDSSVADKTDRLSQPHSILSNYSIMDYWGSSVPGFASRYDWMASGVRQTGDQGNAGWPTDPSTQLGNFPFQSIGPYNMAYKDSVEFVYVVGANGISRKLAEEYGRKWLAWYRNEPGATFDDAQKDSLIATGRDSLFQTFDRALWAWNRNLKIPSPPPSPDLTVTSGPNRIILEWTDLKDVPDANTGVPDLDHYNIYRKRGDFLCDTWDELRADGTHIKWEKIAEVPKNQTKYIDTTVVRGEAYHYAVTAVDDGTQNTDGLFPGQKLESSKYANRSEVAAIAFSPGESNSDSVRVVPNPYIIGAGDFNFTGEDNKLLFVNLPAYCTLKIYTATGDLIKVIDHIAGNADDSWDMVTESTQYVSSGVYILQVTNARDVNNKKIPDAIEKFVIIR